MKSNTCINIMGGAYFDKTYKVKYADKSKRLEKFRYDDTTSTKDRKEKEKEYKMYIKEINDRPLDINFKLRFITNLLMNTLSYKDGMHMLDNFSSEIKGMKTTDKYIMSNNISTNNISNIIEYFKEHYPTFIDNNDKYWEDPNNASAELKVKSMGKLQTILSLLDKENPLKRDICKTLGINDFTMLKSTQSYHGQPSADCLICAIRSFVPGLFEKSSDDSIENAYNIRKLLKIMSQDMRGITGIEFINNNPIISEIPINFIYITFILYKQESFGIQIATNSNIIKGAPFIISNNISVHAEPFFIDIDGESTDATELKAVLNSSTDDIPKYIDALHQYAGKNSLSMIYRKNLKELQRTFDVDVKNEKKILKQAYKLTMDRINA